MALDLVHTKQFKAPTLTQSLIQTPACYRIIIIIILGTYMRPISGEPEKLTNTQGKNPKINCCT